jgi:hypothetical protein
VARPRSLRGPEVPNPATQSLVPAPAPPGSGAREEERTHRPAAAASCHAPLPPRTPTRSFPLRREMRPKYGLVTIVISISSFVVDAPSAYALSSWDCAGWTVKLTNTCDNVLAYFHVCYGRNGEFGTANFNVPPTGGHQIHVEQYSTFISSCGVIPPFTCPARMGPLPLDHCD